MKIKSPIAHMEAMYELKRLVTQGHKVTMTLNIPTKENPEATTAIVVQKDPKSSSFTVSHLDTGEIYHFGARDLDRICDIDWEVV